MAEQPYSQEQLTEQLRLLEAYEAEHPHMGDGPADVQVSTTRFASVQLASFEATARTVSVDPGAQSLLDVARAEIGYCRWDDPQEGTKYGRWYADMVGDPYYGYSGVAYCAMFASWCLCQVGATAPGFIGAYCPWIVTAIRNAGRAVSAANAQPGDVVLFDWEGDGTSDHVGFVESNDPYARTLTCIEGNTTGSDGRSGSVARRIRAYSNVVVCCHPTFVVPDPGPPHDTERPSDSDVGGSAGPVYRLYNPYTYEHLWTTGRAEYDNLGSLGWQQEGVAWTAPASGSKVHRMRNPYADAPGAHHYTVSLDEACALYDLGWENEGIAWLSSGGAKVYRLYNPYTGEHFFTADQGETLSLMEQGWTFEGVGFLGEA